MPSASHFGAGTPRPSIPCLRSADVGRSVPVSNPPGYPVEGHARIENAGCDSRSLEVETNHVRDQLREHGVGRHEERPEQRDERRGDHEPRATAEARRHPAARPFRHAGWPASHHKRKRRGCPRVQCAQRLAQRIEARPRDAPKPRRDDEPRARGQRCAPSASTFSGGASRHASPAANTMPITSHATRSRSSACAARRPARPQRPRPRRPRATGQTPRAGSPQ